MRWVLFNLIRVYQWVVSPAVHLLAGPGMGCRFDLTCSEYALKCLQTQNLGRAITLILKRVSQCHPFSKGDRQAYHGS